MSIQENVNKVEVYYNGHEKAFDDFIKSTVKGYITEDDMLPDEKPEDEESDDEDAEICLAI